MPKYITSYIDCLEFLPYLERTCSGVMSKRRLVAAYSTVWLSEVIFPIAGKEIRGGCIYLACKMAFGTRFALAPALVNYLCTRLKMIGFLVRCAKPYKRYFGEHLLYTWFVYHCRDLYHLWEQEGFHFTELSPVGQTWAFPLILPGWW